VAQRCSPAMVEVHSHRHSNASHGTRDFDAPEPRLAILGPPAITRRMFAMWRTDRRLQTRFNLRNPLHRRDYLLWLSEEGRAIGLEDTSIATAVAILQRGTSLVSPPPRWPAQAAQAIVPPRETLDAWLTEPICWEFGAQPGEIPMPRVLALLWELRRDARLHFHQRTPADLLDYLAWCLTQGVLDRCVPVDLAEPSLAAFLDSPDPEFNGHPHADQLPVTRLLRVMAPLYDGPYAEIARQFPHNRQARFCIALWVCCALRRRYGWPQSFVRRPSRWLSQVAPEVADAFVPLNNLLLGIWGLRPDLQARFDLRHHEGRAAFLAWFLSEGRNRFELEDPRASMRSAVPDEIPGATSEQPAMVGPKQPVKRDLCLVGYAGLISGRAEDLRMSGVALRRQGWGWVTLDRLSGKIKTENGRTAAMLAEPPRINLVHLNADTAFFDYLFLRERAIAGSYTIGYWAWELAKFPAEWASSFAFVDEIWAATRFAYEAIRPATTKPVLLMPSAVSLPVSEPGLKRADFGLPDDTFVFYFGFDFRSYVSRKNPLAAVEAFRRAFPRQSAPVFLLIKTIGSSWKQEERKALCEAVRGDSRVVILDREFARPRATGLLALTDCFLSLHRSEGFGRGPAEAMLLGKPVIMTDYSGTRDFATPETALLVGYDLVPVGGEEYPGGEGQVWAEPDIEQAAAAMRRVADDSAFAQRLGSAGRHRIRELYDPRTIGRRYVERLEAITRAI
jgi:glycosyltransferase involved in cell wall biosynthesis